MRTSAPFVWTAGESRHSPSRFSMRRVSGEYRHCWPAEPSHVHMLTSTPSTFTCGACRQMPPGPVFRICCPSPSASVVVLVVVTIAGSHRQIRSAVSGRGLLQGSSSPSSQPPPSSSQAPRHARSAPAQKVAQVRLAMPPVSTVQPSAEHDRSTCESCSPAHVARGLVVVTDVVVVRSGATVVVVVTIVVGRGQMTESHGSTPQKRHSAFLPSAQQPRTPALHHGSQ
mmetsp:Transcript_103267/g.266990  ORF Transcript_103267/g.266990 Transcript_103267/m.266990 type:complete len:227 (-) Transcript_103267:3283-3963(-)